MHDDSRKIMSDLAMKLKFIYTAYLTKSYSKNKIMTKGHCRLSFVSFQIVLKGNDKHFS